MVARVMVLRERSVSQSRGAIDPSLVSWESAAKEATASRSDCSDGSNLMYSGWVVGDTVFGTYPGGKWYPAIVC
jgi:hypothetical protein